MKENYSKILLKPGFHIIVSDVGIVSVAEYFVVRTRRKARTRFCRDDRIRASDVRIF